MDDAHGNVDTIGLSGMSYDNTGMLGANTLAARRLHRAVARRSTCRCRASGCPARTRQDAGPSPADHAHAREPGAGAVQRAQRRGAERVRPADDAVGRPRDPLADVVGRLQALHARRLPGRLPDRRAVPHRVRHRRRPAGHLQRLRLLRAGLPVRGHRPAQGRRPGLQVHDVLRPADRRADAGVRDRVPDAVDPVRRPRRAAGAGRRAAGDAAGAGRGDGAGCTGGTRTTASAATGRSSCCSTSRRSTACRRTRSSPTRDLPAMWKAAATGAAMIVGVALSAVLGSRKRRVMAMTGGCMTGDARPGRAGAGPTGRRRRTGRSAAGAAAAGPSARSRWSTTPSSPPTTGARSSRRRCGRPPTCRCTCSSVARPGSSAILGAHGRPERPAGADPGLPAGVRRRGDRVGGVPGRTTWGGRSGSCTCCGCSSRRRRCRWAPTSCRRSARRPARRRRWSCWAGSRGSKRFGGVVAAAVRRRRWPPTRRCCWPTRPCRRGTSRTTSCRSCSPARRWPPAAG